MAGEDDDDRTLFEQALESMSASDVYRGKYGTPPTSESNESPTPEEPSNRASREELARLREKREMENAFAGIEKIERGKYHLSDPVVERDAEDYTGADAEFAAAMKPPAEREPSPEPEFVSLVDRFPNDAPSLNLRGMDPEEALTKLGLFIDLASKDGDEFAQLKIGSNSDLLKAVSRWMREAGSVYILEFEIVQQHADAAVFAQIRRSN